MPRYRVLKDGEVVNRIEWCGHAKYDPGEGCTLELDPDPDASPKRVKTKPLPHPDESDPVSEALVLEREENERLRAENEELKEKLAATQLPPNPAETKLSDYGEVGPRSETDWLGVPAWLAAEERDGESIGDRISRLTETFRARVNELTNLLLAGTITEDEDRERTRLLAKYNELAELGDRS